MVTDLMLTAEDTIQRANVMGSPCYTFNSFCLQFCTENISLADFHFMFIQFAIMVKVTFRQHLLPDYFNYCLRVDGITVAAVQGFLLNHDIRSLKFTLIQIGVE